MGFRDFISNFWYRRRAEREFKRFQNIKPPANPSQRYIDKLVRNLMDENESSFARKELELIGAAAAPSLTAALKDKRFLEPKPLDLVLGLLVLHDTESLLAAAMPLTESKAEEVRKTAAIHIASLGRTDTLAVLAKLLQDEDGYVRSYVAMGMDRAVTGNRTDEEFRRIAYDLLLAQCDQDWGTATNDAARFVVSVDPERSAVDFSTPRWMSCAPRYLFRIIEACNEAGIVLPESLVTPIFEDSAARAVGPDCYPQQYLAAAALKALTHSMSNRAKSILETALEHESKNIYEAAAEGMAKLAGVDDAVGFVHDRERAVGLQGLTHHQRVVSLAFWFGAEVCNGGIMQLFGNTSGNHLVEMLDALRELGHEEAISALETAMRAVGPLSRERDRDLRLVAFEDRYDELEEIFRPLEGRYWKAHGKMQKLIQLYAVKHAGEFRPQ